MPANRFHFNQPHFVTLLQWFKSVPAGNTILSDSVNVKHFHANHLYFTGKYLEASQIFSDVFDMVPPGNSQLKREVAEGLARSLMKAGKIEHALDAAEMFVSVSYIHQHSLVDCFFFFISPVETLLQE